MRIEDLDPQPVWRHFTRICAIPRGSGNEAGLREMIVALAKRLGLPHRIDEAGNLLVQKAASTGPADRLAVIVQAHLDMVCEQNAGQDHDFAADPIRPHTIDDRWVTADGTTLGADNGIGVAAMLALMTEANLSHGPLALLFTVSEETGMHGARRLSPDWFEARCLINLDAENDGTLIIGCAGSRSTTLELPLVTRAADADQAAAKITVAGLVGGHSGMDIHRGRANPIRLMVRLLRTIGAQIPIDLAGMCGGLSLNALARRAEATIGYPVGTWHSLKAAAKAMERIFQDEVKSVDPGLFIEVQAIEREHEFEVFTASTRDRCLDLLTVLPHGVLAMEPDNDSLVRTSTNLAFIQRLNGILKIGTKQRSLIDSELDEAEATMAAAGRLAGSVVSSGGHYPAWRLRRDSRFLNHCIRTYEKLFDHSPRVGAMHAGLECGLFAALRPELEILAIGPNILDPHSPQERVEIASVAKFWRFLTAVLSSI